MTKLDKSIDEITKKYGAGSVFKLGGDVLKVEAISTGLPSLDAALGVGGLPKGRIIEIYGQESSSKTTLCYRIIAEVQKLGGLAVIIDMEHTTSKPWIEACGVDVDNLYIVQAFCGEDALEIAEVLIRSKVFDVVVVDSTSALVCRADIEGEMGQAHVGLMARLMSQGLRKLHGPVKESGTLLIFISQMRQKISGGYGNPNVAGTGESLKFYASVRMETARGETLIEAGTPIGSKIKVDIRKNKVAAPFKKCELRLYFDRGLDPVADTVLFAVTHGIIEKRGAWFIFGDLKEQGETNFINMIRNSPEAYTELQTAVAKVDLTPKKR